MGKRCIKCKGSAYRNGLTAKGIQRYRCRKCGATFQKSYRQASRKYRYTDKVLALPCNGVSARGTANLLGCSVPTVLRIVAKAAKQVHRPQTPASGLDYEIDEMRIACKRKKIPYYLTYAICRQNKQIVSYVIGRRNKRNLGKVVARVLSLSPRYIYTDKYSIYPTLIPRYIYKKHRRCTNLIEGYHLKVSQAIQRLSRRTVSISRTLSGLSNLLRIFFWNGDSYLFSSE